MFNKFKLADDRGVTFIELLISVTLLAVLGTPLIAIIVDSVKMNAISRDKQYVTSYMDAICQEIELGNYERPDGREGSYLRNPYTVGLSYFNSLWEYQVDTNNDERLWNNRYEDQTIRRFVKTDEDGYVLTVKTQDLNPVGNKLGSYSSYGFRNYYRVEFNPSSISIKRYIDGEVDSSFTTSNSATAINDTNAFSFVFSDTGFTLYKGSGFSSAITFNPGSNGTVLNPGYGYFGFGNNVDEDQVTRNIRIVNNKGQDLVVNLYNISETDSLYDTDNTAVNSNTKKVNVFFYSAFTDDNGNTASPSSSTIGNYPCDIEIKYDNNIELHDLKNLTGSSTINLDTIYKELLYIVTISTDDGTELLTKKVNKMYRVSSS